MAALHSECQKEEFPLSKAIPMEDKKDVSKARAVFSFCTSEIVCEVRAVQGYLETQAA